MRSQKFSPSDRRAAIKLLDRSQAHEDVLGYDPEGFGPQRESWRDWLVSSVFMVGLAVCLAVAVILVLSTSIVVGARIARWLGWL